MSEREVINSATAEAVHMILHACDNGHYWVAEQQSGHGVCAWCNTCDGSCVLHAASGLLGKERTE